MKPSGSDVQGYLISRLLGGSYDTNVPARAPPGRGAGEAARYGATITEVSVSVQDIVIESINVPAGTFEATFWLQTWWIDKRLTWPSTLYSGSIQVMASLLWTPTLYVKNHLSERTGQNVGETLVTVNASGVARWGRKITGEFACGMSIEPYPYDVHECHLNITSDVPIEQLVLHPDPLTRRATSLGSPKQFNRARGLHDEADGVNAEFHPSLAVARQKESVCNQSHGIDRAGAILRYHHACNDGLASRDPLLGAILDPPRRQHGPCGSRNHHGACQHRPHDRGLCVDKTYLAPVLLYCVHNLPGALLPYRCRCWASARHLGKEGTKEQIGKACRAGSRRGELPASATIGNQATARGPSPFSLFKSGFIGPCTRWLCGRHSSRGL